MIFEIIFLKCILFIYSLIYSFIYVRNCQIYLLYFSRFLWDISKFSQKDETDMTSLESPENDWHDFLSLWIIGENDWSLCAETPVRMFPPLPVPSPPDAFWRSSFCSVWFSHGPLLLTVTFCHERRRSAAAAATETRLIICQCYHLSLCAVSLCTSASVFVHYFFWKKRPPLKTRFILNSADNERKTCFPSANLWRGEELWTLFGWKALSLFCLHIFVLYNVRNTFLWLQMPRLGFQRRWA